MMSDIEIQKSLASRLCYLSLTVWDRVSLWLTYKGLKPASIIVLNKVAYSITPRKLRRIRIWIKDAGLICSWDPFGQKSRLIVSSKLLILSRLLKITKSPLSDDEHYQLGIALGYPRKVVSAYAYGYPKDWIGPLQKKSPVKRLPEAIYAGYMVRIGHEKEDIRAAGEWMKIVRRDIPKLARWFEKDGSSAIEE